MTASTIKSSFVTNAGAPESLLRSGLNATVRRLIDTVVIPTTSLDDVSDKILLCLIPSNAILSRLSFLIDDLDSSTGLVLDVGVANGPSAFVSSAGTSYAAYGEIAAATFMLTTATQAAVQGSPRELVAANLTASVSELVQPLWQRAGLPEDPTRLFTLQIKVTTAATTPVQGSVALIVDYSV